MDYSLQTCAVSGEGAPSERASERGRRESEKAAPPCSRVAWQRPILAFLREPPKGNHRDMQAHSLVYLPSSSHHSTLCTPARTPRPPDIVNVLCLLYIWVFPNSPVLFVACYCLSHGPLCTA